MTKVQRVLLSIRPEIPLKNYLLNLTNKQDRKECGVYVHNLHSIIQDIWRQILAAKGDDVPWQTIIEKLGIHPQGFYAYKNGKKGISILMLYKLLRIWQKNCKKSTEEFDDKWAECYHREVLFGSHKGGYTRLPKSVTPRLSYLIGWICGDGNFGSYGNHYLIKISEKCTRQLKEVLIPLIEKIFCIKP